MNRLLWAVLTIAILNSVGLSNGAEQAAKPAVQEVAKGPEFEFPKFDFDFPGGSPQDLVAALNKALNGSVNVILPSGSRDVKAPALKVKGVTLPQLFAAFQRASVRVYSFESPDGSKRNQFTEYFEITTPDNPPRINSIWSLRADHLGTPPNQESTRFYQLAPYLDDLKIDDIITAIQTGYKMQADGPGPNLKFHPETKLLIAVGKPSDFSIIDNVLLQLGNAPHGKRAGVLVLGEVNKPGYVSLPNAPEYWNIFETVRRAGGRKNEGSSYRVRLWRPGEPERDFNHEEVFFGENQRSKAITLRDGDVIEVRPASEK